MYEAIPEGCNTTLKVQIFQSYVEENANSNIDFIVCSTGVKRNYQNYLASYKSNVSENTIKLVKL